MEVTFSRVDSADSLAHFKKMLVILFPVAYPTSYFKSILSGKISAYLVLKVAGDDVIGCISWREKDSEDRMIEILNLGIMVRYRR